MRAAVQLLTMVGAKNDRLRFRTFYGSHLECQFYLMTFGIPKVDLLVDEEGNVKVEFAQRYFEKRRQIEAVYKKASSERIDYPTSRDILLGRGKPYQEFSGNVLLAIAIDARRDEYARADRFEKTCISIEISKQLTESGSRFLTRDKDKEGWILADENVVREKISSGFRTKTRRSEAATHGGNGAAATDTGAAILAYPPPPEVPSIFEDFFHLKQPGQKRRKVDDGFSPYHPGTADYQVAP